MRAPLEYGVPDQSPLGNIIRGRLRDLAEVWQAHKLAEFQRLFRGVLTKLYSHEAVSVTNWHSGLAPEASSR